MAFFDLQNFSIGGVDVKSTLAAYQSGGATAAVSAALQSRMQPAPIQQLQPQSAAASIAAANPPAVIGTEFQSSAWYKKPIVWIGAGVGVLALFLVLGRRK